MMAVARGALAGGLRDSNGNGPGQYQPPTSCHPPWPRALFKKYQKIILPLCPRPKTRKDFLGSFLGSFLFFYTRQWRMACSRLRWILSRDPKDQATNNAASLRTGQFQYGMGHTGLLNGGQSGCRFIQVIVFWDTGRRRVAPGCCGRQVAALFRQLFFRAKRKKK